MEYKSICPKCNESQTRWDSLEIFPGFINQCGSCGTEYKTSKYSCYAGILIGVLLVVLYILADKNIIHWYASLFFITLLVSATIYLTPFFVKLHPAPEADRNIVKMWMLPFIRGQILPAILLVLLIFANNYIHSYNDLNKAEYKEIEQTIVKTDSAEKLKIIAKYENFLLISDIELFEILISFNNVIYLLIIFNLSFNFIFYFKIKHTHNNTFKRDAKQHAPLN